MRAVEVREPVAVALWATAGCVEGPCETVLDLVWCRVCGASNAAALMAPMAKSKKTICIGPMRKSFIRSTTPQSLNPLPRVRPWAPHFVRSIGVALLLLARHHARAAIRLRGSQDPAPIRFLPLPKTAQETVVSLEPASQPIQLSGRSVYSNLFPPVLEPFPKPSCGPNR